MVLGFFVFERRTLPHQSMQYSKDYRWVSNDRIGRLVGSEMCIRDRLSSFSGREKPRAPCRGRCTLKSPAGVCRCRPLS